MYVAEKWWRQEGSDEQVVCTLCPRQCRIAEGSRGFCYVRANRGGQLELTTYGRGYKFTIAPIEKTPMAHFMPGTGALSLGTAGCNLGCQYCPMWDLAKAREVNSQTQAASPEDVVAAAKKHNCASIVFTYNDPVVWAEYAIDIARVARKQGLKTVADTAGYISPEARGEFFKWMDAVNVDIKAFREDFYRKRVQGKIKPVLETLKYLVNQTNVWVEVTNMLIPRDNDSPKEVERMCGWILHNLGGNVPVHFTGFHPSHQMTNKPRTRVETLIRARDQALDMGLRFAYVSNVHDMAKETTNCPNCGNTVLERLRFEIKEYNLDGAHCDFCGAVMPGVFEGDVELPGSWGKRSQPIEISGGGKGGFAPRGGASDDDMPDAGDVSPGAPWPRTKVSVSATGGAAPPVDLVSLDEDEDDADHDDEGALAGAGAEPVRSGDLAGVAAQARRKAPSPRPAGGKQPRDDGGEAEARGGALLRQAEQADDVELGPMDEVAPPRVSPQAKQDADAKQSPARPTSQPQMPDGPADTGLSELSLADSINLVPNPKVEFTTAERRSVITFAKLLLTKSLGGYVKRLEAPEELIKAPCFGLFLSLRRQTILRACLGRWGATGAENTLGGLMPLVVRDASTRDTRFPSITLRELELLEIELSFMHDPQLVEQRGADRADSIEPGEHGVVLVKQAAGGRKPPEARGMLLPQVAAEHHYSAPAFLEQVCLKAGLPGEAWKRDPDVQLMTFRASSVLQRPSRQEFDPRDLSEEDVSMLGEWADAIARGNDPPKQARDRKPLYQIMKDAFGVFLESQSGLSAAALGSEQSLLDMAEQAGESLRQAIKQKKLSDERVVKMTLLWQPITLRPNDFPKRHIKLSDAVILARRDGGWSLNTEIDSPAKDKITQVLDAVNVTPQQWTKAHGGSLARLTAFAAHPIEVASMSLADLLAAEIAADEAADEAAAAPSSDNRDSQVGDDRQDPFDGNDDGGAIAPADDDDEPDPFLPTASPGAQNGSETVADDDDAQTRDPDEDNDLTPIPLSGVDDDGDQPQAQAETESAAAAVAVLERPLDEFPDEPLDEIDDLTSAAQAAESEANGRPGGASSRRPSPKGEDDSDSVGATTGPDAAAGETAFGVPSPAKDLERLDTDEDESDQTPISGLTPQQRAGDRFMAQDNDQTPASPVSATASGRRRFGTSRFRTVQPEQPPIRMPSRAGRFYPADPDDMTEALDRFITGGALNTAQRRTAMGNLGKPTARALLLPHAGWKYSGATIGKTISRVYIPDTVIVVGPKHTPLGPSWSSPPHQQWSIPGGQVTVASDLIARMLELLPALQCEPQAHEQEYSVEVLLPFLHRLNPDVRVAPLVMGRCSYHDTSLVAGALAQIISERQNKSEGAPLIIISSDLNHFAPLQENQRRDQLALDALQAGDPKRLYQTCIEHDISMCGVLSACSVLQALRKVDGDAAGEIVQYTHSGEISGDTRHVVGYAGMIFE